MHIKKTPNILRREAAMPASLKSFVTDLVETPEADLIKKLVDFSTEWNRPRGDLCHWVPILDRIDSILETNIKKYGLDQDFPKPLSISDQDEQLLIATIDFSAFLLEKCSNRGIYSSVEHLAKLLNCTSTSVLSSALNACVQVGSRIISSRAGRAQAISVPAEKIYQLATFLPLSQYEKVNNSEISLFDFIDPNKVWSESWGSVSIQYYLRSQPHQQNPAAGSAPSPTVKTPVKGGGGGGGGGGSSATTNTFGGEAGSEGLTTLNISAKEVQESSIEDLLKKIYAAVPQDYQFTAINKVRVAKACVNTEKGLLLRQQLCKIQCMAMAFATCMYSDNQVNSKIMIKSPFLIRQICELANPDRLDEIPVRLVVTAMQTLEFACNHNDRFSEVVSGLGGNVSHGIAMSLMRGLLNAMKSNVELNERYTTGILQLMMSMTTAAHHLAVAISPALCPIVAEMVQTESPYIKTLAFLAELLDHLVIDVPTSLSTFQENKGSEKMIEVAKREVDKAVDSNNSSEQPPTLCSVDYSISYFRTQWLRGLLGLISNVLSHTRTAERINNLSETSLLSISKIVINNPQRLGNRIVSLILQVLSNMLETEPSTYGIMHEAQVTDEIVSSIPSLLERSTLYFSPVAKFISALCHNEHGLKLVKDKGLLTLYFSALAENIMHNDGLKSLGMTFDLLTSDHPDLRKMMIEEALKLLQRLPQQLSTVPKERFYSESEGIGESPLPTNDVMYSLGNAVAFYEGFLKNHLSRVEFIKQRGVKYLLQLFEIENLPYEFAYSQTCYMLSSILKSLFDLDIDSDYIQHEILGHLDRSIKRIEDLIAQCPVDTQIVHSDEQVLNEISRRLGQLNSTLFAFFQVIFVSPGTGYRIMFVLDKVIETEGGNVFERLGAIQRWCVWQDARSLDGLSTLFIEASKPVPVDSMPRHYRGLYDREEFKKIKEAQSKLENGDAQSPIFKRVKVFRFLAHANSNMVSKFFYEFATACTNDRALSSRKKNGLHMAEMIATSLIQHLEYPPIQEISQGAHRSAKYQSIVNIITTIQRTLFRSWNNNASMVANLGVLVMFKQKRGIEMVAEVLQSLWTLPVDSEAATGSSGAETSSGETRDDDAASSLLVGAQKTVLSLLSQMVSSKAILDNPRSYSLLSSRSPDARDSFNAHQFYVECRIMALYHILPLWDSDELESKHKSVSSIFIDLMSKLLSTHGEDSTFRDKDQIPRELTWRCVCPSEDKVKALVESGSSEQDARNELLKSGDDIDDAAENLGIETSATNADFVHEVGHAPIDDKTNTKLVTFQDLSEMREKIKNSLIDRALNLIQGNSENVFAVSGLVIKANTVSSTSRSDRQREALASSQKDVVTTILQALSSLDASDGDDHQAQSIEAVTHLLGLILQEPTFFSNCFVDVAESIELFVSLMEYEHAQEKPWFPKVLLILERILTNLDVPQVVEREFDFRFFAPQTSKVPSIDEEITQRVFNKICSISKLEDENLTLAVARLLVFFSKVPERAVLLLNNGTIAHLLKSLPKFSGGSNYDKIQTALILILREAVETEEQIRSILQVEIRAYFSGSRVSDANSFVKSQSHLVARAPKLFVEVASELLAFQDSSFDNTHICLRDTLQAQLNHNTKELELIKKKLAEKLGEQVEKQQTESNESSTAKESDVKAAGNEETSKKTEDNEPEDTKMKDISSTSATGGSGQIPVVDNPSGVIQLLLTELFSLKREDVFTRPEKNEKAVQEELSKKPSNEFKPSEHPKFIYCCTLLQFLAELVVSYNKCKLEFLNFSKKSFNTSVIGTPLAKPRSFALNHFLHELLPAGSLNDPAPLAMQEWMTVSHLSGSVLYNLLLATQEKGRLKESNKRNTDIQADPTLTFVRKFTLDAFSKVLRDVHFSNESVDYRYSVLTGLTDLCHRFLSPRPGGSSVGMGSTNVDSSDSMAVAKIMYEKKFGSILTANIAEIDLNYPNARKVSKSAVRCLNKLTKQCLDVASDLSHENNNTGEIEEEFPTDDSSDEEFREDTPDLFRNSTLGMFEVNDEYDDEDLEAEGGYDEMEGEEEMEDYSEEDDEALSDVDNAADDMDEELGYDDEDEDSEEEDDGAEDMDIELVVESNEDDEMEEDSDMDESEWESYDEEGQIEDFDEDIELPGEQEDDEVEDEGPEEEDEEEDEDDDDDEGEDPEENEDGYPQIILRDLHGGMNRRLGRRATGANLFDDDFGEMVYQLPRGGGHQFNELDGGEAYTSDDDVDEESGDDMDEIFDFQSSLRIGSRWDRPSMGNQSDAVSNPLLAQPRRNTNRQPFFRQMGRATDGLNAISQMVDGQDNDPLRSSHVLLSDMFGQFAEMLSNPGVFERGDTIEIDPFSEEARYASGSGSRQRWSPVLQAIQRQPPLGTPSRWQEASLMFHVFTRSENTARVLNGLYNGIAQFTKDMSKKTQEVTDEIEKCEKEYIQLREEQAAKKKQQEEEEEAKKKREQEEEEEAKRKQQEEEARAAAGAASNAATHSDQDSKESEDVNMANADEYDNDNGGNEQASASGSAGNENTEDTSERVFVSISDRDVDITGMGIDPTFLEALPADIREEAFTQHLRDMRQQQRNSGGNSSSNDRGHNSGNEQSSGGDLPREIDPDFLDALPDNIRRELLQDEQIERRQRAAMGAGNTSGGPGQGVDMDLANFLATLTPGLREQLLLEQDDLSLATFPQDIAEEARGLRNRTVAQFPPESAGSAGEGSLAERFSSSVVGVPIGSSASGGANSRIRRLVQTDEASTDGTSLVRSSRDVDEAEEAEKKKKLAAAAVHLVDRAGAAALVRLLYLPQPATSNSRTTLDELFLNLAHNKSTRLDLLNILLHVLQDGSSDRHSLEKGFAQTSNRARQAVATVIGNTPSKQGNLATTPKGQQQQMLPQLQSPKLSVHNVVLSHDISPATVMHQTLEVLESMVLHNTRVKHFFLSEHEHPVGFKKTKSKGKGKDKEREAPKEWKYPVNMLLNLLDRTAVRENNTTLEMVTSLLQEVTRLLPSIVKQPDLKRNKSNKSSSKNAAEEGKADASGVEQAASNEAPAEQSKNNEHFAEQESNEPETKKDGNSKSKKGEIEPPYIPEYNLKRVSGIMLAKECHSKTFQQTLAIMQHLSSLPGVRDLFGRELLDRAMSLGPTIVNDLKALVEQVRIAEKGSDIQGTTLAKFSSGSSDQTKLLRVLTAIDYLFDSSRSGKKKSSSSKIDEGASYLKSLYESMTFGPLWGSLSDCLLLVQDRQDMIHVATALLPLIEALMVICKHSSVKDVQIRGDKYEHRKNDFETEPLESLFFTFTDEHRKILNQIVRTNPKLMSGSFSILVKNPKALEFDNKRRYFYRRISPHGDRSMHNISLNVRRDQVFLDSYKALYFKQADEIKNSRLSVRFQGEEGVDAGGVTREWYQVLSRQMFNPDYALFIPVASDKTTFHPNRTSWVNPEHLSFFKFIGRIIGKAIFDNRVLDCHFSRAVYKKILGKTVSIKDMESLDLDYYKSLLWMLENDITDIITETFSIEAEDYGEQKVIDLKPGGRDIPVTEENKREYVNLVVEYRLLTSIKEQMDHFLEGFHDVIPKEVVAIFDEQELELLISGMPDIDLDDWKNNTEYHNYSASSPQIKWFWRAVRSFDEEEKAKLLQFATGTSKVPLNGFGELEGMNGIQKFNIHRDYGSKDRLPSSHTCFNQIDLPGYDSYETLRGSLLMAISEGREGFGFA